MPTVPRNEWPAEKDWPKPGWKHALNYQNFRVGDVFSWYDENGRLWTGLVEDSRSCAVLVTGILPGVLKT